MARLYLRLSLQLTFLFSTVSIARICIKDLSIKDKLIHLVFIDENYQAFYGQISMGSPPQSFNMTIDIRNSLFWVASDKCNSSQYPLCQGSNFQSGKSTTYNTTGQKAQFVGRYLTNEGYLSADVANIGE